MLDGCSNFGCRTFPAGLVGTVVGSVLVLATFVGVCWPSYTPAQPHTECPVLFSCACATTALDVTGRCAVRY